MHALQTVRITVILLAMCLAGGKALAQKEKKEEPPVSKTYLKSLKSKQRSTTQLLQEASALVATDPTDALNKVEEALAMSITEKDRFSEGKCYLLLGSINEHIEEWKLALENYARARDRFLPDYTQTAEYRKALRGVGQASLNLGQYQPALTAFTLAADLARGNERTELSLDLSETHYRMGDYTQALTVLDNATAAATPRKKVADETADVYSTTPSATDTRIANQRAKIYARSNNVDKAQKIFQSSQNNRTADYSKQTITSNANAAPKSSAYTMADKKAGSPETAKEEIANALHENKQYDDEIALRNLAIELNTDENNMDEVSSDKLALGKTLVAKGEIGAAIHEIEEAARIADTTRNPAAQTRAYRALADLYEKNGRTTEALSAYRKYSDAAARNEARLEAQSTERSDLIRKQKDIEELSKHITVGLAEDTIAKGLVTRQRLIIYGLLLIIALVSVTTVYMYRSNQARQRANHMLALKSLRSQMNPHFIFNALNSVNHFITQSDERTANKFLAEFSRLMRLVLENSQENFIPLHKEEEIITLYLKLEHYRFRDKFDYTFTVDDHVNRESFQLPPMLIQPYIENAVWHGLRYKTEPGILTVAIQQQDNGAITVTITDNGIGRKRSAEVKTDHQKKHNSTGMRNMDERLAIINRVYRTRYAVHIEDLDKQQQTGTRVTITLPPIVSYAA